MLRFHDSTTTTTTPLQHYTCALGSDFLLCQLQMLQQQPLSDAYAVVAQLQTSSGSMGEWYTKLSAGITEWGPVWNISEDPLWNVPLLLHCPDARTLRAMLSKNVSALTVPQKKSLPLFTIEAAKQLKQQHPGAPLSDLLTLAVANYKCAPFSTSAAIWFLPDVYYHVLGPYVHVIQSGSSSTKLIKPTPTWPTWSIGLVINKEESEAFKYCCFVNKGKSVGDVVRNKAFEKHASICFALETLLPSTVPASVKYQQHGDMATFETLLKTLNVYTL